MGITSNPGNPLGLHLRTIKRIQELANSLKDYRKDGKYGYTEEAHRQARFIVEDHKLAYDADTIAKYIIEKIEKINK